MWECWEMGGDEEKWSVWLVAQQQLQLSLSGGGAVRPGGFVNSPMWFLSVRDIGFLCYAFHICPKSAGGFVFVWNCACVGESRRQSRVVASFATCFLKFCLLLSFSLITLWFTGDWWSTRFAIPIEFRRKMSWRLRSNVLKQCCWIGTENLLWNIVLEIATVLTGHQLGVFCCWPFWEMNLISTQKMCLHFIWGKCCKTPATVHERGT